MKSQFFQAASKPFFQTARNLKGNKRSRIDIVSPSLCNDALKHLGPSLQAYEGCTIIDINPGLGLWSSKVHDFVKPKQHILAEPPASPFLPHLKPLANQLNSRYHLLDWPEEDVWSPDRYIAEGLLPPFDNSKSKTPSHSILILANTRIQADKGGEQARTTTAYHKLRHWCDDISLNTGFHAGGPVRMLLWFPEKEKRTIIPRTIQYRSTLSLFLEMTSHAREIVCAEESLVGKMKMRDKGTDLMSGQRVAQRMQETGIMIPDGRQIQLYEQLGGNDKGSHTPSTGVRIREWHKELHDLQQRFRSGDFVQADGMDVGIIKRLSNGARLTPEYARLVELERNLKHIAKRAKMTEELLQDQNQIDSLDAQANDSNLGESRQAALQAEVQERKSLLQERVKNTSGSHTRDEFKNLKDERKAYGQNPPLLQWDQRKADPIKAYNAEFHPEKGLCLIDVEKKRTLPYPMSAMQWTFFSVLMAALWKQPTENLSALNNIAPGAFEAITPHVPALTDPGRGGERDLLDLPVNRLTPEMAYGIMTAWLDWPFQPDLADFPQRGDSLMAFEKVQPVQ
ncbi:MAG: hypothetical protein Q9216_001662 [Gyalolechia sp. 2 TL-2023]